MARLPIPGKDAGTWGDVLNDYLSEIHKGDGTLKDDAVTTSAIARDAITANEIRNGSISEAQLDSSVQDKLNAAGSGNVADGTITTAKLQDNAVTDEKITDGTISEVKLNSTAQAKLNQAAPTWSSISGKPSVVAAGEDAAEARAAIGAGTSNLALGTSGGTAKAGDYHPTWTDVLSKPAVIASGADQSAARAAIGAGTSNLTLAGSGSAGTAARSDHSHAKFDVGLGNADNTSDVDKPVSTAVQTALDGKVSSTSTGSRLYGTTGAGIQATYVLANADTPDSVPTRDSNARMKVGSPSTGKDAANKEYVDTADFLRVGKDQMWRNILDFGVVRGTASSQTVAIKSALDSHPGEGFFFPPGDYRLDTQLNITEENSLHLAPGCRIYAGAAMDILINWDNEWVSSTGINFLAQDRCIIGYGARIDANLLANVGICINNILRFNAKGFTVYNPLHRGFVGGSIGSELIVQDIRVWNTTINNVIDNVGIECRMSDAQFSNISMRDLTVGIWTKGGSCHFVDIHPWLGDVTQLTARYENSVGFLLEGDSTLIGTYADTYRFSYRTSGEFSRSRLIGPRAYCHPGNLSSGLAENYPGAIFSLDTTAYTSQLLVADGYYEGHPDTNHQFVLGDTTSFNSRGIISNHVTGGSDYRSGVQLGLSGFTATLRGSSVPGTSSGTVTNDSYMLVEDHLVTYRIAVYVEDLGSDILGELVISGLPMPPGSDWVSSPVGTLSRATGATGAVGLQGPNSTTSGTITLQLKDISGSNVAATPSVTGWIIGTATARYGRS